MPGEKLAAEAAKPMIKYGAVAGLGIAGFLYLSGACEGSGENIHATEEEQQLEYIVPGMFETEIGSTVVSVTTELSATRGDQVCTPMGCVGAHKTNDRTVTGSGENEYIVDFPSIGINTTREDENEDGLPDGEPLPEDEVTVYIDPTSLTIENKFDVERVEDKVLTVEDGRVVRERLLDDDGETILDRELDEDEQWPIFREDGRVELPGYKMSGGEDFATRALESVFHGLVDIGNNRRSEATAAAAISASDPACDAAARDILSGGLTELAQLSAESALAEQGYNPENVTVVLEDGAEWPAPEDVQNADGLTFNERVDVFESHLGSLIDEGDGEAVSLEVDEECAADDVVDTSHEFEAR